MKNKLKILWLCIIPLGWYLAFLLAKWVQFYPIVCDATKESPIGLCIFLTMTGVLGSIILIFGSFALTIYLISED